jgi:RimJ/RimL family protein N-acetyltransferase
VAEPVRVGSGSGVGSVTATVRFGSVRYDPRVILGEKIRLRRPERADLPRFARWLNDPEVRRHLHLVYPMSEVLEERWFEDQLKLEPALQAFVIEAARIGGEGDWNPVGVIGWHVVDWRNRTGELGIVIGEKSAWNSGLGTDAVRTLVRWGFRELNLNRAFLRVFEDNPGAIRCYEKAGFRHEGRLRQDRYQDGRYLDTVLMGVLRDEFGAG